MRAADLCAFSIVAYCLMPDHMHVLVKGMDDDASLSSFTKRAKQLSGYHGRQLSSEPIWQPGYFERVLRDDEDTRVVAAYILNNPVRAGLVSAPGDYRFSGSGVRSLQDLLEWVAGRSTNDSRIGRPDLQVGRVENHPETDSITLDVKVGLVADFSTPDLKVGPTGCAPRPRRSPT